MNCTNKSQRENQHDTHSPRHLIHTDPDFCGYDTHSVLSGRARRHGGCARGRQGDLRYEDRWDPHAAFGTLMLLVSLLILLAAFAARPGRPLLGMTAGLFVFMVIQFFRPFLNDSASTRWVAALHGANALIVTGLAIMLVIRSRPYWLFAGSRAQAHPRTAAEELPA